MFSRFKITKEDYDTLELPDRVHLNLNQNARRIALRLDSKSKSIRLTVPKGTAPSKVQSFVNKNILWINNTLNSLPSDIILKENSTFPYMGKHITLKVITDKSAKTRKITLEETDLTIRTSSDIYSERLKRWIINDFKEKVKSISEEKSLNIKKEIKSVRVSDTKTRWGSCSHDGRLCFSWRLAFAPYEAIDYVVAHEVAHLRHLDHSKEFWTLCEELSIDYAAGKRWMKENGSELMRYVFAQ
ncbi:MAG: hypothetical protein CMH28_01100 [Micavibrio sp.]|nr:hypothetical protein [Micavibrio sp.]|tara:strand:+ start:858 stop:1586 length:729 start_codon:yes stop_codon:yes gene_type:complete